MQKSAYALQYEHKSQGFIR